MQSVCKIVEEPNRYPDRSELNAGHQARGRRHFEKCPGIAHRWTVVLGPCARRTNMFTGRTRGEHSLGRFVLVAHHDPFVRIAAALAAATGDGVARTTDEAARFVTRSSQIDV